MPPIPDAHRHRSGTACTAVLAAFWIALFGGAGIAAAAPDSSPVTVVEVRRGALEEVVELTGTVTAQRRSSLSARTSGLVSVVHVDAGSRVKKGDVLLELDSALAKLALERAESALKQARTELTERQRLYDEVRQLVDTGGIARTEVETRRTALSAQEALVNQAAVDVKERTELVERHQLLAPFGGMISAKNSEVGEWVQTGVAVLDLVEVDNVRFDVQAPQERYSALNSDVEVIVRLDSAPGKEFPATISAIVPVKDPVTRTFLVRLQVEASEGVMAPGVSGSAVFRIREGAEALTIPRDAVVRQPDGSAMVWLVQNDGAPAEARPVRLGASMAATVAVLEGLEEGQRVVLRGNETLREGQAIRVLPAEEAAGEREG